MGKGLVGMGRWVGGHSLNAWDLYFRMHLVGRTHWWVTGSMIQSRGHNAAFIHMLPLGTTLVIYAFLDSLIEQTIPRRRSETCEPLLADQARLGSILGERKWKTGMKTRRFWFPFGPTQTRYHLAPLEDLSHGALTYR